MEEEAAHAMLLPPSEAGRAACVVAQRSHSDSVPTFPLSWTTRGLWALPPELARCPLQRLDLMRCGLTELPIAVGTLGRLEELSLGCNHISWLPTNLQVCAPVGEGGGRIMSLTIQFSGVYAGEGWRERGGAGVDILSRIQRGPAAQFLVR